MRSKKLIIILFALGYACTLQTTTLYSQNPIFQNPSPRSWGMGTSSVAVYWGLPQNSLSNPAVLGYLQGIRYQWGKTPHGNALSNSGIYRSHRIAAGHEGFGLELSGKPLFKLGGGRQSINFYDELRLQETSGSGGVSFGWIADHILESEGSDPIVFQYFDCSIGYSYNDIDIYGTEQTGEEGVKYGESYTQDIGFLVRISPYNSLSGDGYSDALDSAFGAIFGGLRVDLAYGESWQNIQDVKIPITLSSVPEPFEITIPRRSMRGWSVHLETGFPERDAELLDSYGIGWLPELLTPLLQWSYTWERLEDSYRINNETGERASLFKSYQSGWELSFANIFSLRRGKIEFGDESMESIETTGWGLGFNVKNIVEFRYDRAMFPENISYAESQSEGFVVVVNLVQAILD